VPILLSGETLFRLGVAIMAAAAVGGIVAAVVLRLSGKHLKEQLNAEFGKKHN